MVTLLCLPACFLLLFLLLIDFYSFTNLNKCRACFLKELSSKKLVHFEGNEAHIPQVWIHRRTVDRERGDIVVATDQGSHLTERPHLPYGTCRFDSIRFLGQTGNPHRPKVQRHQGTNRNPTLVFGLLKKKEKSGVGWEWSLQIWQILNKFDLICRKCHLKRPWRSENPTLWTFMGVVVKKWIQFWDFSNYFSN